jgi:hypothetical protein
MTPRPALRLALAATVSCAACLAQTPRLRNFFMRHTLEAGHPTLPGAFMIEGDAPMRVLIRATGPTLGVFGVTGTLGDPVLTIFDRTGAPILENDNWGGSAALVAASASIGAFSFSSATSRDAALLATLEPGAYSYRVAGVTGGVGVTLLEIYALDASAPPRLAYFAALGAAGTAASPVLIFGFVVAGSTFGNSVITRGLGPALAARGVAGTLQNPTATVFSSSAAGIAGNNDWVASLAGEMAVAGLMPLQAGSLDAVPFYPLNPGAYTVQVSSSGPGSGIALAEVALTDPGRAAAFPPALIVPPAETTPAIGTTATLSALALGKPAPTYQWRKDGAPIAGATSPALVLANFQAAAAGNYTVAMTNAAGTPVSAPYLVRPPAAPGIATPPSAQGVAAGGTAIFTVSATGAPAPFYQWLFNGVAIAGANSATLRIANVQAASLGVYSVRVTNPQGSITSPGAVLTFALPPTLALQPVAAAVPLGALVSLSVAAAGNAPFTYQWLRNGGLIAGATNASHTIASAAAADAGNYVCLVGNAAGTVLSDPARLEVQLPARLINVSLLTPIAAPGGSFTLGFVAGGASAVGPMPLVARAAGPSLGALGVAGALDDPRLELFAGAIRTAENDNWGGGASLAGAFADLGAFAFTGPASRDAAVLANAVSTDNSVRVSATGGGTGAVIAEIYDATPLATYTATRRRLVNVSALKEIGAGFTLGFVIGGVGERRVLVRAVGPGLVPLGVSGAVADPRLALFAGPAPLGENDNWSGDAVAAAAAQVGAFPLPAGSRDAALLASLPPGAYSVQVAGVGGATGLVIVEIYEAP